MFYLTNGTKTINFLFFFRLTYFKVLILVIIYLFLKFLTILRRKNKRKLLLFFSEKK